MKAADLIVDEKLSHRKKQIAKLKKGKLNFHRPPRCDCNKLKNQTRYYKYCVIPFSGERGCILTEDNLISVQEETEAKHWLVLATTAQMVNHMTSQRGVHGFYACVHVYVQEVIA